MNALPGILIASSANPGPFPASYRYFMEPDRAHFAPETGKNGGSSVFLGKIGVAPACRSPSPPVGFTVILAGQKGLGMNTKIHPNCNLTATLQSGQAADART